MLKTDTATIIGMLVLAIGAPDACRAASKDTKVLAAAQAARAAELQLLEQVVNIDSGTGDVEGGRRVAALLVPHFKAMGMTVESLPAEAPGLPENTVATITGRGKTRILMIGHIDTVFGPGTAQSRPYHADNERAWGPGVSDEKAGVVEAVYALQILHDIHFRDFGKIVYLMDSSEERGSPGSKGLIARLAADADVELNLEPAYEPDGITVQRKGPSFFRIDVQGRAAHAGSQPQEGRNAVLELIHQLSGVGVFPTSGPGITVNITVIHAGSRTNVIPDSAYAMMDVRVPNKSDFDRVEETLRKDAETTVIPDTKVVVSHEAPYPPLPRNPATDKLAERAQRIYAAIGRTAVPAATGGGSESALAADAGVPALDGLGPVGDGFHSDREHIDLETVTPRLYLLAKLLMELGPMPPARN